MKIILLAVFSLHLVIVNAQDLKLHSNKYDYTWHNRLNTRDYINGIYPPTEELIELLDSYHLGGINSDYFGNSGISCYDFNKKNVTPVVKQKILSLLRNEWTYHEVKMLWVEFENERNGGRKQKEIFAEQAFKLSEKQALSNKTTPRWMLYNSIYDSITNTYRDEYVESAVKNKMLDDWLIKTVALLGYKEAIPTLQEALNDPKNERTKETILVALAKLGDKNALEKVLDIKNMLSSNPWGSEVWDRSRGLLFLRTQESISKFSLLMDTTQLFPIGTNWPNTMCYSSAGCFYNLLQVLKNKSFHDILKDLKLDLLEYDQKNHFVAALIIKVRDWLIVNKGKYEIDSEVFFQY